MMRLERDRGFRVRRWGVSVPCCIFPLSFFLGGGGGGTHRGGCGFLKDSSTWANGRRRETSGAEQRNHQRAFISAHFAAKSAVKTAGWESLCISCHIMAVTFQRNYLASQIFISRVHVNT